MNAILDSRRATKAALLVLLGFGLSGTAAAQTSPPAQFDSEADAISGSVQRQTLLGIQRELISAQLQAIADIQASQQQEIQTLVQEEFGVRAYNFDPITDSATASDTMANDSGSGSVTTNAGSLVNGLVTWTSLANTLSCQPDSTVQGQVDCASQQTIAGLKVNGVAVNLGTYPAGETIPVTGTLTDPECLLDGVLGTETFQGQLQFQESETTGDGTNQASVTENGLYLTGIATCSVIGQLLPLFQTTYNLKVAGPKEIVQAPVVTYLVDIDLTWNTTLE